jgi:hypothetical protein
MGPIKFLNRRFGLGGGIFNHFDGSVDLLDDLDDHYTARTHKRERNALIERLQVVCAQHSVRITILGGDVHLAALGRFYSNPKLNIPIEQDFRFMTNVVSSAIVNKPPPGAVANLLARRNKIHHLNHSTDETLLKFFDKDPGDSNKTANHNQVTMPSRNFAIITENSPNNKAATSDAAAATTAAHAIPAEATTAAAADATNGDGPAPPASSSNSSNGPGSSGGSSNRDGHYPLHAGEQGAGTRHRAADPKLHGSGVDGSLDVCIRVEIDQHNREGLTQGYGITIPVLSYDGPLPEQPHRHAPHLRRKKSGVAAAAGFEGADPSAPATGAAKDGAAVTPADGAAKAGAA